MRSIYIPMPKSPFLSDDFLYFWYMLRYECVDKCLAIKCDSVHSGRPHLFSESDVAFLDFEVRFRKSSGSLIKS